LLLFKTHFTSDDRATFGQDLKKLEDKGVELHAALKAPSTAFIVTLVMRMAS